MCRKLYILRIRTTCNSAIIELLLHKDYQSKEMITLFLPVDEDWFPSEFVLESLKNCLNALIFMSIVSFPLRFLDAMLLCHDIEASVF